MTLTYEIGQPGDRKMPEPSRNPQYNLNRPIFSIMRPQGPHMPITETYVTIPPALWIRDEENALWTLGFDYDEKAWRGGQFEYDIVRNGRKTGEFGRIIEMRSNKQGLRVVRIWGAEGWRQWSGRTFT